TALHPGRQLVVLIEGRDAGPPIAVTRPVDERLVGFRALVQDLADIQHMSGVYFPMPMSLSDEDLEQIADVHRLLSGETQTATWSELTLTMTVEAFNAGLVQEFTAGEVKHLFTESELILVLDRQELLVGRKYSEVR
ncbi:MAG TPA: hypothetical protein VKH61_19840, partial [Streptosporangiaceae bacterium]|nr:hypothetical protein [Streptosporangiaceae bacterium]